MKRFIDDIAIEVIEAKLVSKLENMFTPLDVVAMDLDLVARIAGESEESRAQREQLTKQLEILTKGSDTCRRFIEVRLNCETKHTLNLWKVILTCELASEQSIEQPNVPHKHNLTRRRVGSDADELPELDQDESQDIKSQVGITSSDSTPHKESASSNEVVREFTAIDGSVVDDDQLSKSREMGKKSKAKIQQAAFK